jgi:predicted nucleic acid-binding protein
MILIDTGPLVAIHDYEDPNHQICVSQLAELTMQPIATTWACFTEAIYLLGRGGGFHFQSRLWRSRRDGLLQLLELSQDEADRAEAHMAKYRDLPMDLADATLVAVAEIRTWRIVFTLDEHFFAYRLSDGSTLDVVLPKKD